MMNGPKIRQILSFKLEHDRDGQKFRNLNLKQQKKMLQQNTKIFT